MRTEEVCEVAWIDQPGRITSRLTSVADGFRGSGSLADFAVVAEDSSITKKDIQDWISALRDGFSGGVVYGVGDLLFESLKDLRRAENSPPSSFTAAAILGGEVWVFSTGRCLAIVCSLEEEEESIRVLEPERCHHLELTSGSVVVLVSQGLKRLASSPSIARRFFSSVVPVESGLKNMVDDTRIRFRKQGGSAAVLRYYRKKSFNLTGIPNRRLLIGIFGALILLTLAFLICRGDGGNPLLSPEGESVQEDMVQPLD